MPYIGFMSLFGKGSDKSQEPNNDTSRNPFDREPVDRAPSADKADGDVDVPTYRGETGADVYSRVGRTAPQTVEPQSATQGATQGSTPGGRGDNAETTAFPSSGERAGAPGDVASTSRPADANGAANTSGASHTSVYRPKPAADSSQYSAGDYGDRDFAPAAGAAAGGATAGGATSAAQPQETMSLSRDDRAASAQQPTQQFASSDLHTSEQPAANAYQDPNRTSGIVGAGAAGAGAAGAGAVATQDYDQSSFEHEDDRAAVDRRDLDDTAVDPKAGRRGTIDFGLLFVRLALGVYLIIAGASTFFGLGASEGLSGLEGEFADYAMPGVLAIAVPTMQLVAGVFLVLGLVTPLAAAIGLVVTGFMAIHRLAQSDAGLNIFDWPEAMWLSVILFVIAVALQFTGPGFISLDFNRSWARRPLATSWIFVVIAVAALVAIWWFLAAVNPLG